VNKILYSIVPSDLVAWSRTFIRGTVLKIGMLAGSLLMIALKPVLTAQQLSPIAAVLAFYWVVETLIFRKRYKRILKQVIVEKQIDFDEIESVRAFDSGGTVMAVAAVPVEDRSEKQLPMEHETKQVPSIDPDTALKLLDDANPRIRADAAASFALSKDMRAVGDLVRCLEETDDDVRQSAIEALISYGESILPFLEVSLVHSRHRTKQGILEVIRLSGLRQFEIIPFLGEELSKAYGNLIALRGLQGLNGSLSSKLLKEHLDASTEEILSLIFYALWVTHADMRLMYQALKSESASIAVELVENSIRKEMTPYLIPLIEDIPVDEKIEKGQRLLPLVRNETPDRLLNILGDAEDPLTRILALFVIGELTPKPSFIPLIQERLQDEDPFVRDLAGYARKRCMNEVATMPDIIEKISKLRTFGIFEGMGVRELHAIASVMTVERFDRGDIMIKEGEENSSIYLVVSGNVTVVGGYGTPDEREKATIGPGSFLGELSLFTRMAPNATCVAAEPAEAYVLRHHQFQEIMRVYPQIGINLCRFFTMKLRQVAY
jgi:Cyclic nucleotide-binding domain/HEAT repeats